MGLIVQVRGTSGSGKSTVVRKVMRQLGNWVPVFVEERRRPLYYTLQENPTWIVLGHYEVDCGGCDTIGSAPKVYEQLRKIPFAVALTEGLLWGEDVKWTVALRDEGHDIRSFYLNTGLEECLRRVKLRQDGREPADPARVRRNLETRIGRIARTRPRLEEAGIVCVGCSSEQAVYLVTRLLRLHAK